MPKDPHEKRKNMVIQLLEIQIKKKKRFEASLFTQIIVN